MFIDLERLIQPKKSTESISYTETHNTEIENRLNTEHSSLEEDSDSSVTTLWMSGQNSSPPPAQAPVLVQNSGDKQFQRK